MSLIVEGRSVGSLTDFLALFASHPNVPDYFGHNLDALDEVLGEGLGPSAIKWTEVETSRQSMGSEFERLVQVLRDNSDEEATHENEWRLKFR